MKLGSSNFFNFTQFKLFMISTLIKYSRLHKYSICHRLSDWMYYIICGHWPMLFFPFSLSLQIWLHHERFFSDVSDEWKPYFLDKGGNRCDCCCSSIMWYHLMVNFRNHRALLSMSNLMQREFCQYVGGKTWHGCVAVEMMSSQAFLFVRRNIFLARRWIPTRYGGEHGADLHQTAWFTRRWDIMDLSNANWKVSANKEQMLFPQILASNADVAAKSADDPIFWYRGRFYFNSNPIFSSTQWNVFRQYHLNLQEKCAIHLRCILPVYVAKSTFFLLLCFEVVL